MSKCKLCTKPATIKEAREVYCAAHYIQLFMRK